MKRLFSLAGALVLAAMLSGCLNFDNPAVTEDVKPQIVDENGVVVDVDKAGDDFLNKIGSFTLGDLNQAMILAGDKDLDGVTEAAPSDQLADQCYFYLAGKVAAAGDQANQITVAGVVSAFQVARNFRREGGLSDEFKAACGGLIMDVRGQFLKRGIGALPIPGIGGLSLFN